MEGNQQLPNVDQAQQTLDQQVRLPVFFQKLAARGYNPQTEQEVKDILKLAGDLRQYAEQNPEADRQQSGPSKYAQADQALHQVTGQQNQQAEVAVKQAAQQVAQQPSIYNAMLTCKAAQAAQVRQQLDQQNGQNQAS